LAINNVSNKSQEVEIIENAGRKRGSTNYNGFVSSKNVLVFFAYFIRIAKRNNFVEEISSIIRALFRRENSI
jgi:hypothetical protein